MDVVEINGAYIAFRYRPGLGRTIAFANSLGSDQSIWDEVVAHIPGGYGVLTYDLRGHGLSSGAATSIEGLADDLSELLDILEINDVLFCGVSIGGMIGQVLAARRPDIVKAAVLCNTGTKIGSADRWQDRINEVEKQGLDGFAPSIIANWFGRAYATNTERLALHQTMVSRTSKDGYIAACQAISAADLQSVASDISIPALCIGGNEDKSVSVEMVEQLAQSIPAGTAQIIEGLGHLPCLEIPSELARLLLEFDPKNVNTAEAGTATRRKVLGNAHVDRAVAQVTPVDEAFQSLITSSAWGSVWSSPAISARERSMLTLALLAAVGNFEEIPMHIRATEKTGATQRDVAEAFQHVAIYAGVPRANHALKLAKQTFAEMEKDD